MKVVFKVADANKRKNNIFTSNNIFNNNNNMYPTTVPTTLQILTGAGGGPAEEPRRRNYTAYYINNNNITPPRRDDEIPLNDKPSDHVSLVKKVRDKIKQGRKLMSCSHSQESSQRSNLAPYWLQENEQPIRS